MISFVITTKNEGEYIKSLLSQLNEAVRPDDEIIIVDDFSDDLQTREILDKVDERGSLNCSSIVYQRKLDDDFASQKNFGIEKCTKEWIFQIDADELLGINLEHHLHHLLENNPNVDLLLVPRVNIVNGLTQSDIIKFGWRVNEENWVMWPDFQHRIFKNNSVIKWEGRVHETITGHTSFAALPTSDENGELDAGWALLHVKDIERQREQNELYSKIQRQS